MESFNLDNQTQVRASMVARIIAHFIDWTCLLFGTALGGIFGALVAAGMLDKGLPKMQLESQIGMGLALGLTYWFSVLWFLNFGVLQGIRGSSIGKATMHLCVTNQEQKPLGIVKSTVRSALYLLSYITLGTGFLPAFLDQRQRAWHDQLLKTRVLPLNCLRGPYAQITPRTRPYKNFKQEYQDQKYDDQKYDDDQDRAA